MPSIALLEVPAAYRRGLASAAADTGWDLVVGSDPADVVITPLAARADCERIDGLVAGGVSVLALVQPFERDEIAHALRHGVAAVDWDADPERIFAAAAAAAAGDLLVPVAAVRSLAPGDEAHAREPSISEEEAAWLVALSQGVTVVRLSDDAGFSERAMFRRLADVYARLGARGRTEALLTAERLGLLRRDR